MKFAKFRSEIDSRENKLLKIDTNSDKSRSLENILEIVRKINGTLDLEEVLELVLKSSIEITNSERGFVFLANNNNELEFRKGLTFTNNIISKDEFSISNSVLRDVFKTGEAKFMECAKSDTQHDPSKSIFSLQLETILCSPFIKENKIFGVIYVDSRHIHKIKIKEITATFEILAGQAAIAISNAKQFQDQKRINEALEIANTEMLRARKEVEKSEKLKYEFLSQMSHEIRTPINNILGFTSILKEHFEESVDKDLIESCRIIDKGGRRLIRTMDLILNMSQIHAGIYELNKVEINLFDDILLKLKTEHYRSAREKGLLLTMTNNSSHDIIEGDFNTIHDIFDNLMHNAIKYTIEGSIDVCLFNDEDEKICVDIKDTGIGISKDYLPHLFAPFSQEQSGYTRQYEGNGLALALIKEYSKLNDADIEVYSKKNEGSIFRVKFNSPDN